MEWKESLEWEANIAEFVLFLHRETRAPAVPQGSTKISSERVLRSGIPIYGPRFLPPSLNDMRLRRGKIKTETTYLLPINIIHPVYYDNLGTCPHCGSTDVKRDSWNATSSREVHGLRWEETALGSNYATRHILEDWEHWEIPRGIPYFFSCCAVSRDLFDLIIELRSSSTPGGLAENIKQLHLLEYHEHSLQYFQAYTKANATPGPFSTPSLEPLSSPIEEGYNDTFITDEMMREVYMAFVERTRSEESDEYLRNLSPGICLSADNTFKAGGKATVADSSKARSKLVKSTLNFLNEGNEIVAWRFCQPASPAEMREVLEGFKKRCVELYIYLL
ncbi:hypothetical protein C8J57DRAFT_1232739 [Mycena rebaudengoi]|nr:hypothetical protein C8J57DRAFT_1232739 [Mycena rebaudengoi]